jgi:glycosyltransferase involved in cell wall biosynthesis
MDHVELALEALAAVGDLVVLNLGHSAPVVKAGRGRRVRTPGTLPIIEVGRMLAASDLALMPLRDGASSGHTTLMAALCNGVPVVSTRGSETDAELLNATAAITLTPPSDPRSFAEAAVTLARDGERRRAVGEAGRRLYDECFDWRVLADAVLLDWTRRGAGDARVSVPVARERPRRDLPV